MPDQWDPKYPKDLPMWSDDYVRAWASIYQQGPWGDAFAAIVAADKAGGFARVRAFFDEGYDVWEWRHAMWDLYFIPMFTASKVSWPAYAQEVHTAVTSELPQRPLGAARGIPSDWHGDLEKVWTFKSTLLLVTGLIEGALPATQPNPQPTDIRAFVEQQMARLMRRDATRLTKLIDAWVVHLLQRELQPFREKIKTFENLLKRR